MTLGVHRILGPSVVLVKPCGDERMQAYGERLGAVHRRQPHPAESLHDALRLQLRQAPQIGQNIGGHPCARWIYRQVVELRCSIAKPIERPPEHPVERPLLAAGFVQQGRISLERCAEADGVSFHVGGLRLQLAKLVVGRAIFMDLAGRE
jgi:hypothetical protein